MDYTGPDSADLADVYALNLAALQWLRCERPGENLTIACRSRIAGLSTLQAQRLAEVPFLLLSLRERDTEYWARIYREEPRADLFAAGVSQAPEQERLAAAIVGFLWQLARRNPYAARLVSGASVDWCERLASQSLFDVFRSAATSSAILVPRLHDDEAFWCRLLGPGISSSAEVREAAQICALQAVVPVGGDADPARLRNAACRSPVPTLQL